MSDFGNFPNVHPNKMSRIARRVYSVQAVQQLANMHADFISGCRPWSVSRKELLGEWRNSFFSINSNLRIMHNWLLCPMTNFVVILGPRWVFYHLAAYH